MLGLVVPVRGIAWSVVSTNAPFGIAVLSVRVAVVTALSRAALQAGMLSPVTVSGVAADTFWTAQSEAANAAARQTGSENCAVIRNLEMVKLLNDGFDVSAK